jgi:hypothetical protein
VVESGFGEGNWRTNQFRNGGYCIMDSPRLAHPHDRLARHFLARTELAATRRPLGDFRKEL